MAKMYFVENEQVELIEQLFKNCIDNQYIVLTKNNTLADIAQYSCKYQNVHINTVPVDRLDPRLQLSGKGFY